ncbi:MAG: hypothetical protein K2N12_01495 [Helicobacter sp.]|nr:hypothetical protein [Helicobacter sp.]
MQVWNNKATRSYNSLSGIPPKANALLQNLKQRFSGMQIEVGIPNVKNVFRNEGNNHLMLPVNILQKMAKDSDYTEMLKQDFQVFEQQMLRDTDNDSVQSSGFFIDLDESYGAWAIVKNLVPNGNNDSLRRTQQERQQYKYEGLEEQLPETQHWFSKRIVVESGVLYEQESSPTREAVHVNMMLDLRA